jgi:hypothetical protein
MKVITLIFLIFAVISVNAQTILSEDQIRQKTDSVLKEANLIYEYEKAAWVTTDLAFENIEIKNDMAGYIAYQQHDTTKTIIINKNGECILETKFITGSIVPANKNFTKRNLNENEIHLLLIRDSIVRDIENKKINISCPDGFSLNLVLIPASFGYKLYILTGTSQPDIIPFGNDYLIISDDYGQIISWKKFHSRLIATPVKAPNGEDIIEFIHSHLKTEPFISATDICTFKLYAPIHQKLSFSVYSPALSKSFRYLLLEDSIEIKDGL